MARRLPSLNAIRAFEAAARHGSFVAAAEVLHVTAAAISHQVKHLEQDLGTPLFRRLPRGLLLTDAGQAFAREAAKGLDHIARAADRARGVQVSGRLVLSILPSICTRWVLPRLPAFCAQFPEIDPVIQAESRPPDLHNQAVDIALWLGGEGDPGCRIDTVFTEEVFPVCSPTLMLGPPRLRHWSDLRGVRLLHDELASPDEPWISWRPWLETYGLGDLAVDLRGPCFTDSVMMYEAAATGLGIAIGRSMLVADDLASGRLVRPFEEARPLGLAYHVSALAERAEEAKIAAFRNWVLSMAEAERPIG